MIPTATIQKAAEVYGFEMTGIAETLPPSLLLPARLTVMKTVLEAIGLAEILEAAEPVLSASRSPLQYGRPGDVAIVVSADQLDALSAAIAKIGAG